MTVDRITELEWRMAVMSERLSNLEKTNKLLNKWVINLHEQYIIREKAWLCYNNN